MKLLAYVLVGLLFLTGCGSEASKELKYDELDLMIYQQCLDNLKVQSGSRATPDQLVKGAGAAKILCEEYLPIKK